MKKSRNIIKQYSLDLEGQEVTISVVKPKQQKRQNNARHVNTSCPNCASSMELDSAGLFYCTGNKLSHWNNEFYKYYKMTDIKKVEYLTKISKSSMFFDLYDKWVYARQNNKPEDFNCGYTNNISLPIGSTKTIIPDPLYVLFLEQGLKRPLKPEELTNESELWVFRKRVFTKYRKGSKLVKIPYISIPDEVEVRV